MPIFTLVGASNRKVCVDWGLWVNINDDEEIVAADTPLDCLSRLEAKLKSSGNSKLSELSRAYWRGHLRLYDKEEMIEENCLEVLMAYYSEHRSQIILDYEIMRVIGKNDSSWWKQPLRFFEGEEEENPMHRTACGIEEFLSGL
jgi:hypothetical protein